jgi:hypothetical protein
MTHGSPAPTVPAVLVVHDGRHPLALLTLTAAVLSGVLGILGPPNPNSVIDKLITEPWRSAYYVLLTMSALTALLGVWLPKLRDRLFAEQVGLWFLSGTLLIYPLAIYTFYPGRLGFGGVVSCLVGLGGLWRITEIVIETRRLRRALGTRPGQ